MEYMDAGSLDGLAGCNIPEPVLQRVTASMVRGLKFLKDELQTMHRGAYICALLVLIHAQRLISCIVRVQTSSRPTFLSTRREPSSCATLACRVSLSGAWQRQTSAVKATWQ
jgi:hypothetical protein